MKKVIKLPKELAPHKNLLKETMTSFFSLEAHAAAPDRSWDNKIGGVPHMSAEDEWPMDSNGKPMFFLAQINLNNSKGIVNFPSEGMLQFFLSENYMVDEMENKVAVRYRKETNLDKPIEKGPEVVYEDLPLNISTPYALTIKKSVEIAPLSDVAFDVKMGEEFWMAFGENEYDIRDQYNEAVSATGHKMGGYAYFAQEDPRDLNHDEILLLQLDSDDTIGLKWGDMGVAHFFIKESDLQNKDFSKVTFHWDCH